MDQLNTLSSVSTFSEKGKKGQFRRENNNKAQGQKGGKRDTGVQQTCYKCGGKHLARDCRFKTAKCHACSKIGHIARACRKNKGTSSTQYVGTEGNASRSGDEAELFGLYAVYSTSSWEKGYTVDLGLGDQRTTMLLDTGSAVSVVSDNFYQANLTHFPLKPARKLKRTSK